MILEIINDRMNGKRYTENDRYCMYDYAQESDMSRLVNAFDMEDNKSVRRVLCSYIAILISDLEHRLRYIHFINSNNWL